jgi:HSP20 family protein
MITRYSPIERLYSFDRFNKLMEELWGTEGTKRNWFPAMDAIETEKEIKFVADLPGMTEKDINVELQDNLLTIRGERKSEETQKTQDYVLCERSYGSFERRFTVNASVKPDQVKASFEHGVLTVTVPKLEAPKPKKIAIEAH